jgi:hypothetical protein
MSSNGSAVCTPISFTSRVAALIVGTQVNETFKEEQEKYDGLIVEYAANMPSINNNIIPEQRAIPFIMNLLSCTHPKLLEFISSLAKQANNIYKYGFKIC